MLRLPEAAQEIEETQMLEIEGWQIGMVHSLQREFRPMAELQQNFPKPVDIMVAGHTHQEVLEYREGVVLMNSEDDLADTICPRLDKMEADDSRIVALEGVMRRDEDGNEWRRSFSLENDLRRLEEVLTENPDTRLVVIDPISAYIGGVDSHKNLKTTIKKKQL